jgi:UDP-N-acetylglucosamine/UDP-N-acetylgalactosamine diphosphorylase
VLAWWEQLTGAERRQLLDQLQTLDLDQLHQLYISRDQSFDVPAPDSIAPAPVIRLGTDAQQARSCGEAALRQGEVAILLVAGGQGSRLGFEHAKGMFGIAPVTNKTLFQIHAEKVQALKRRYGRPLPFLMMTSPATDAETRRFFAQHQYFGFPPDDVSFFCQGTMPALDMATGQLLMEAPSRLFLSPNGHGGTLTALADSGLLDRMRQQGIKHVFYFQVDNPLVKVADPFFLGHHLLARAEVSSRIVPKEGPTDPLGNLVLVDGRCTIIEYSDLPPELAKQTDSHGRLRIWAGSPAIHIFDIEFLRRMAAEKEKTPFHTARKRVPYLDRSWTLVQPEKENALKFERFIFDVLPSAERWTVVESDRREEFVPLKNGSGPDSPPLVRQGQSDLAADWLERAGVPVPRRMDGSAAERLEISPLYALDAEELAGKVDRSLRIEGPLYLE